MVRRDVPLGLLRRLSVLVEARHEGDETLGDGGDVGARLSAARVRPLENPHRAGERAGDEHVVGAREADAVGALGELDGLSGGDVPGRVGPGEQLDGNVLEQVRELGAPHDLAKARGRVTEAVVVGELGHELEHERGSLGVLARHERRARGNLDRGLEVARADGHLPDVEKLSHRLAPPRLGPVLGQAAYLRPL